MSTDGVDHQSVVETDYICKKTKEKRILMLYDWAVLANATLKLKKYEIRYIILKKTKN